MKKAETIKKLFKGFAVYEVTAHRFNGYALVTFRLGKDRPTCDVTAYYHLYLYDERPEGLTIREWLQTRELYKALMSLPYKTK